MPRIAMIGAGSVIFCKTLMMDIMATEGLEDSIFVLMNRTEPKLRRMESFAKEVVKENDLPSKIEATLDRREALD
ncbi:MAG: alpha-glucosidase/alpha-galactosidase, partial [Armatimonadetes bacterium]|nr:alpha-glucosidase/alpha-galactosidase [Armatimonadota bacterium]